MTGHLLVFSNNKLLLTRRPIASNRYISCEACGWLVLTTCREDMLSDRGWEAGGEQQPDIVSAGAVLCWYRVNTLGSWYQDTDYLRWHAPRWPWSCLPLRCANSKYDSATARCIDNRAMQASNCAGSIVKRQKKLFPYNPEFRWDVSKGLSFSFFF